MKDGKKTETNGGRNRENIWKEITEKDSGGQYLVIIYVTTANIYITTVEEIRHHHLSLSIVYRAEKIGWKAGKEGMRVSAFPTYGSGYREK